MIPSVMPFLSRRHFLQMSATWLASSSVTTATPTHQHIPLPDDIGLNTVSFSRQQRATGAAQHVDPFDIPRLVRDELGLRILDVVSSMLNTREHGPLEKFRARAESAGCVITNLKLNLSNVRYDSDDEAVRRPALAEYKRWIDAAAVLGARWVRPFPATTKPRWETLVASFSELADYAAKHNITLLVENYRWLEKEPDAIPRLVRDLAGRVLPQPDTFNWVDEPTRHEGLTKAFPGAASCDFKVRDLGPHNEHPAYDLHTSFEIGRKAGFRGPWCIEHVNDDKDALLRDLKWITSRLRVWSQKTSQASSPGK